MSVKKLKLTERELHGAMVIEVVGELTIGGTELIERVRARLVEGKRLIVVNMARCLRVDSSGLGELVTCLVTATRHDAVLRLAEVPTQIQGIMKLTNLYKIFEIFDAEAAACETSL